MVGLSAGSDSDAVSGTDSDAVYGSDAIAEIAASAEIDGSFSADDTSPRHPDSIRQAVKTTVSRAAAGRRAFPVRSFLFF